MKLRDKLVVPPRKPVTLADWDPGDTHGFDKEPAIDKIERSIARLDELQYLMYAEHRRALLVVLQGVDAAGKDGTIRHVDRKSTRLNSSHVAISYAVFCLKKKK